MDEPAGAERDVGLRPTLRRLVAGGIALARTRLELASVELAEERARFTSIVALAVAGAVLATLALAATTLFVVAYYWDTHRFEAIAVLVVVYGALAAFAFLRAGAIARRQPTPFAATIAELEKDRRWLAGGPPSTP
jgi:uncharacterized membrane protein YqjE